jgi:hypothetical protein
MGIIQSFTEQHPQTALGTDLRTMHILEAYETTIGSKTKVSVGARQARQGIEGDTVHADEDGRRETGLGIELHPVRIVVVRHIKLNYPLLSKPPILLYLRNGTGGITKGDVSQ